MSNNFQDVQIFGKTSLSDLFKQIHKNNKDIDSQINGLILTMQPFVNNAGSAVMLMPIVKDLIDVNVKNNDQLVRMAAIAQRAANSVSKESESFIDQDEIAQILNEQKVLEFESNKLLEQKQELVKKFKK